MKKYVEKIGNIDVFAEKNAEREMIYKPGCVHNARNGKNHVWKEAKYKNICNW